MDFLLEKVDFQLAMLVCYSAVILGHGKLWAKIIGPYLTLNWWSTLLYF